MSAPTKAEFIAVADILNKNTAPLPLVQDFADYFGEQNPRFNRALFINAATGELRRQRATEDYLWTKEVYPE